MSLHNCMIDRCRRTKFLSVEEKLRDGIGIEVKLVEMIERNCLGKNRVVISRIPIDSE